MKEKIRRICLVSVLSLFLTTMQIVGWQTSMKNGTSIHSSSFFQNIGQLKFGQCVFLGVAEFLIFGTLIYLAFTRLEKNCICEETAISTSRKSFWIGTGIILYCVYLLYLLCCYPGFYNYDVGNQIPQVLYAEVPYSAHHPILHTLIEGGIISLGYKLYSVDLTFGIFLYCAFQMAICAVCFTYCIYFVYKYTHKKGITLASFIFYAICPPIVMFAMSTTKDVICYTVLLMAVLVMFDIYQRLRYEHIGTHRWVQLGGLLTLACLFRKNIVYAIAVFTVIILVSVKKEWKQQFFVYVGTILLACLVNKGLIFITNASEGSPMEALSIPVQQIARLYNYEGEEAFEAEELELLYSFIDKDMLPCYDPFISDGIKYAFWLHYDSIIEKKLDFFSLWAKKGLQYPTVYMMAFVDNTYQAWYPGTVLKDGRGSRYFDITDWQNEYGRPMFVPLYNFYKNIYTETSYQKYPIIRLFFSIGFMLWTVLIAWFYGLWKREWGILAALGLVLCVSITNLAGPVSDVRYYLLSFYVFPLSIGVFFNQGKYNISQPVKKVVE